MALIAQVQFLQVMARIGGSEGSIGMAHFANSIGEFRTCACFFFCSVCSQRACSPPIAWRLFLYFKLPLHGHSF